MANPPDHQSVNATHGGPPWSFELSFTDSAPIGFSLNAAHPAVGDGTVQVQSRGTVTTDDGDKIYDLLESTGRTFLYNECTRRRIYPDTLTSFLIVVKPKSARVYVWPKVHLLTRLKPGKKPPGEVITLREIADVEQLEFGDVKILPEDGFVFCFHAQWRPVLYFDLEPIAEPSRQRQTDYRPILGQLYAQSMFRALFKADEKTLEETYDRGWFSFARLVPDTFSDLYQSVAHKFPIEDVEAKVVTAFPGNVIREWSIQWNGNAVLRDHMPFIQSALDAFERSDWRACVSTLYPRIEGILRDLCIPNHRPDQKTMATVIPDVTATRHPHSNLFLPHNFSKFLQRFYFRHFDTHAGDLALSRNSVGHGVAPAIEFSATKSLIGFLIIDQLHFCT